jgi:diaminopropionate ammonia-lyase
MDVLLSNPLRDRAWRPPAGDDPGVLHRALPGYAVSPLHAPESLARELGVGAVWLKDESERFRLPAFKALGAWWAGCCALAERLGAPELRTDPAALRARAGELGDLALVCATEGNHGRAVARLARDLGLRADIYVGHHMARARRDAMASEGADVIAVDGGYEGAVAASAARVGDTDALVISDTAWPGYEDVPARVIEGYATMFAELEEQLPGEPDVAFVPTGVGALAAAAAAGFPPATRLVAVEPAAAACVLASVRAGAPVELPGPFATAIGPLACGTPSPVAWPALAARFDAFCALDDATAEEGVRRLHALGLDRGDTSGATLAAALELLARDDARAALDVGENSSVVVLLTEGVTDPERFRAVVG